MFRDISSTEKIVLIILILMFTLQNRNFVILLFFPYISLIMINNNGDNINNNNKILLNLFNFNILLQDLSYLEARLIIPPLIYENEYNRLTNLILFKIIYIILIIVNLFTSLWSVIHH